MERIKEFKNATLETSGGKWLAGLQHRATSHLLANSDKADKYVGGQRQRLYHRWITKFLVLCEGDSNKVDVTFKGQLNILC